MESIQLANEKEINAVYKNRKAAVLKLFQGAAGSKRLARPYWRIMPIIKNGENHYDAAMLSV